MSRPLTRPNVAVPQPATSIAAAASKKVAREPAPLVIVPESLVVEDLEPKWVQAIETATD